MKTKTLTETIQQVTTDLRKEMRCHKLDSEEYTVIATVLFAIESSLVYLDNGYAESETQVEVKKSLQYVVSEFDLTEADSNLLKRVKDIIQVLL